MSSWEEKIKHKLTSYEYQETPAGSRVNDFFDRLEEIPEADRPSLLIYWRVAAAFILSLGLGLATYWWGEEQVVTPMAERQQVKLPDGSTVQLNASSQLSYNKATWWWKREVSLQGEAFFVVKEGEKFSVSSDQGHTSVLGTSFNIEARDNFYKVYCHTGKVEVRTMDQTFRLDPGKAVIAEQQATTKEVFFDPQRKNWTTGDFYFDNQPLEKVLETLERQFGVQVSFPEKIKNEKITVYFNNRDLEMALKLITEPLDLSYRMKEKQVVIQTQP